MGFCAKCGNIISGENCHCGGRKGSTLIETESGQAVGNAHSNAYLSSGFNSGIETGMKRMLGETPAANEVKCVACSRICGPNEAVGAPFSAGAAEGDPHCKACYELKFGKGVCTGCRKPIVDLSTNAVSGREWIENDRGVWHKNCFTEESKCDNCHNPMLAEMVQALGKSYHPGCFQCRNCKTALNGPFVDRQGQPYCRKCAEEAMRRPSSNSQPTNSSTKDLQESITKRQQELDELRKHANDLKLDEKCKKCAMLLNGRGITLSNGLYFHEECLVCQKCHQPLVGGRILEDNGNYFHDTCFQSLHSYKCGGCQSVISSGKYVEYEGQRYHSDCFTCAGCKIGLASRPFGDVNKKAYCETCLVKQAPIPSRQAQVADPSHELKFQPYVESARAVERSDKPASVPSSAGSSRPSVGQQTGLRADLKSTSYAGLGSNQEVRAPGFTVNPKTGLKEIRQMESGWPAITVSRPSGLGSTEQCPTCQQRVYPADKQTGPFGSTWHKKCLKCSTCKKQLDSGAVLDNNMPYCTGCQLKHRTSIVA